MTYTREHFDAYLATLKFPPNRFQLKVLESVAFGSGNIQVSAVAGSGKTTLLEQIVAGIRHIESVTGAQKSHILPLAFNVTIRDELTRRLSRFDVEASNSNRLGNEIITQYLSGKGERRQKIDSNKYFDMASRMLEDALGRNYQTTETTPGGDPVYQSVWRLKYTTANLTEMCILNFVTPDNTDAIHWTAEHHNLDWKEATGEVIDTVIEKVVPKMLTRGRELWEQHRIIALCEQLTLPVQVPDMPMPKYDWVLIDEAQDLNLAQQALAVRCLKPDGRAIVVGDANQAVYGFAGADDKSFFRLQQVFNADMLDLNISYRCPSSVLDYARHIVPQIEARPDAPTGTVTEKVKLADLYGHLKPDMLVLGRLNKHVVEVFFDIIKRKALEGDTLPVQVIGKDIADAMLSITRTLKGMTGFQYTDFSLYLDKYKESEIKRIRRLRSETMREEQRATLEDNVDTVEMCYREFDCADIKCFEDKLRTVFGSSRKDEEQRISKREDFVSLCTAHKAKGLEAERVAVLYPDEFPSEREGQRPWQTQQEWNLLYVAITRAKDTLLVVEGTLQARPTPFDQDKANTALERARTSALASLDHDLIPGVDTDAILTPKKASLIKDIETAIFPKADDAQPPSRLDELVASNGHRPDDDLMQDVSAEKPLTPEQKAVLSPADRGKAIQEAVQVSPALAELRVATTMQLTRDEDGKAHALVESLRSMGDSELDTLIELAQYIKALKAAQAS